MAKVQLEVLGLTANPTSNGAYALVLKEVDGPRRISILIGSAEAVAIYNELEGIKAARPITHDLIRDILSTLDVSIVEIYINEMRDETYFASMIFDTTSQEVDCRPSDAIAIALRCNSPIFINETLLDEVSFLPEGMGDDDPSEHDEDDDDELKEIRQKADIYDEKELPSKPKGKLEIMIQYLDKAVKEEDYERAAQLRDEISKLKSN
ncbi:MAG: bifunctional nuclease family protein [Ignavibacteria bacterium]|nr:bifunctional nuclease family protein [Ignavibacteria bacterium]